MPIRKIKLLPGVNLEQSPTLNQTQVASCNLIRFFDGLVQKLGGWLQYTAQTFVGTCRGLRGWADINGNAYMAVGTEQRLMVLEGGVIFDITPVPTTTNPAVSFSTTNTSNSVTITDAGYMPSPGDWIFLATQVAVGGLVLWGFYQVATSISGTQYTINAASAATANATNAGAVPQFTTTNTSANVTVTLTAHGLSTGNTFTLSLSTTVATLVIAAGIYSVTYLTANTFQITAPAGTANANTSAYENSGNAQIQYLLPSGYAVNTSVTGYGIGDYGSGDYGLGTGGSAVAPLRQWSLDQFGQYLIASPSNGGIYSWNPPTIAPAAAVSNAPLYSTAVFCMPQVEMICALGAETGGTQQPLLVRWCDAANMTAWTATATNQAGSYYMPIGSALIGGIAAGLGAVLWTDTDVWSMTYIGFPLVFGFNHISSADGLISQRAAAVLGNLVFWLGNQLFYIYAIGGGVQILECPVWDFLWNNIDQAQLNQVFAAPNSAFGECAWHFPLLTSSPYWTAAMPMGYVKYNVTAKAWDYGVSAQYQRTAWVDRSAVGGPTGADIAGLLQQHEVGADANGSPMAWNFQTGFIDLAEGEEAIFSDIIIPDGVFQNAPTLRPNILGTDYPNQAPIAAVTQTITMGATLWITYSMRARQISFGLSGADLGTFFRLGAFRVRANADGRVEG